MTLNDRVLEYPARTAPSGEGGRLYDISDYLEACIGARGITGIQRVQESLAREILKSRPQCNFVFVDPRYCRVWSLPQSGVARLVAETEPGSDLHDRKARSRFAVELCDKAQIHIVMRKDLFVNLGPFWGPQYGPRFAHQLKNVGCSFIPLIYDVIPIDHPALCDERTVRLFTETLPDTLRLANRIITISEHTSLRVKAFAERQGVALPPIDVLHLAHQLKSRKHQGDALLPSSSLPEGEDEFVLCVGTIEPRKNHLFIAEAWARLSKDIARMPTLVIVGKLGWLPEHALRRLRDIAELTGRVSLLHDVPDSELDRLYRKCLFTVFTPLDEGWGLPVGESLASGKICLASKAGAIPEVGGEHVVYVDPSSNFEIDRELRSLIVAEDRRKDMERAIARNFHSRTWADVAKTLDVLTL